MTQSKICDFSDKLGESTALQEKVNTDARRGDETPLAGTPGAPVRTNRAEVKYIISRQIQYIIVGAHTSERSNCTGTVCCSPCQWSDMHNGHTGMQDQTIPSHSVPDARRLPPHNNVPDTSTKQANESTLTVVVDSQRNSETVHVPELVTHEMTNAEP